MCIRDRGEDEGDEDGARKPDATSECPAHKNKGKLTDEQVVGQAVGILLAGYETTANTLAYTSYLLALNPDIQEKLQSEIDSYFDDKPVSLYLFKFLWSLKQRNNHTSTQDASMYEASQEITYLDYVIQESLRLYPPVPVYNI